jgi:hypothetical protein
MPGKSESGIGGFTVSQLHQSGIVILDFSLQAQPGTAVPLDTV